MTGILLLASFILVLRAVVVVAKLVILGICFLFSFIKVFYLQYFLF